MTEVYVSLKSALPWNKDIKMKWKRNKPTDSFIQELNDFIVC